MTNEEVADRLAIRELCDRYHAMVNTRDWSLIADLFAPDAVWTVLPPIDLRFVGLEAITSGIIASVERQALLVQTSSGLVINLGDGRAALRSTLMEVGREPNMAGWFAVALFEDEVVRVDGAWRFAARTVRLQHSGGLPLADAPPA